MNNHKHTKEYFEKLENMQLSDSKREHMRKALLSYAQLHAADNVRVGQDARSMEQVQQRTFSARLFSIKIHHMTAALLIAILVGGGTSYAAQGSVPGDFLYPVKTEVNENVRSAFAFSDEAEAQLQAQFAEERLEEARGLAAEGRLTADASTEIGARLASHYANAMEKSAQARVNGDYEAAATIQASLEGTLRAYVSVLSQLNGSVSGNDSATLISDIESYAQANARATATAEVSADVSGEIEGTLKRADSFLAQTKAKLERAEGELSASAYARIRANFEDAVSAQAQAQAQFRAEQYSEAYASTQRAIRLAQEVQTMISSSLILNVDIEARTDTQTETRSDTNTQTSEESDTNMEVDTDVRVDGELLNNVLKVDAQTNTRLGL